MDKDKNIQDCKKESGRVEILRTLVGSRAHGLAREDSDYDYRGVFVDPTSEILKFNSIYKNTKWIEGKVDDTSFELGYFLKLAARCDPNALEILVGPVESANKDGEELRKLFPYLWNANDAFNAFVGYGKNQRKKFLEKKDDRQKGFACAYVRALANLYSLLTTDTFQLEVNEVIKPHLIKYKSGDYTVGEVMDMAEFLTGTCEKALKKCKHKADLDKVNEFLLEIRRRYW